MSSVGRLKLKGVDPKPSKKGGGKKKKKKDEDDGGGSSKKEEDKQLIVSGDGTAAAVAAETEEGYVLEGPGAHVDRRTPAERRHDEMMVKRNRERTRLAAQTSHRERIATFNAQLASLSEHHDIPRVGPG